MKTDIDLRHLRVFVSLYELRSATKAAQVMQTTQPGISVALSRLREFYGDPLFVRSGQTMQPTSRADSLHKPILDALQMLDQCAINTELFEPETSLWHAKLALPDGGRLVVLPRLAQLVQRKAPNITIEIMDIGSDTPGALERGDIDLAFGFMTGRRQGLYQQRLFRDRYVCAMRVDHPMSSEPLTADNLQRFHHLRIANIGNSSDLLSRALERSDTVLKTAIVVPTALGVAETLCTTDYVAMLPCMAAEALARYHPLKICDLPFAMEPYEVCQHWHRRKHHDASHRWLREQLVQLFAAPSGPRHHQPAATHQR